MRGWMWVFLWSGLALGAVDALASEESTTSVIVDERSMLPDFEPLEGREAGTFLKREDLLGQVVVLASWYEY